MARGTSRVCERFYAASRQIPNDDSAQARSRKFNFARLSLAASTRRTRKRTRSDIISK
jgi:hypothetical protein